MSAISPRGFEGDGASSSDALLRLYGVCGAGYSPGVGLDFDKQSRLLLTDSGNNRIRRVDEQNNIHTKRALGHGRGAGLPAGRRHRPRPAPAALRRPSVQHRLILDAVGVSTAAHPGGCALASTRAGGDALPPGLPGAAI